MKTRRAITEVAPRAFEVALHYASALAGGGFATTLRHDRAAGFPVDAVGGDDLPDAVRQAVEHVAAGRYAVIDARLRTATLQCIAPAGHERLESFALIDATVGGEAWFLATRLVWPAVSFTDTACALAHDQIVIVVDDGQVGDTGVRIVRLVCDEIKAVVLRRVVRDALMRDLILRPAFGSGESQPGFPDSLPQMGERT